MERRRLSNEASGSNDGPQQEGQSSRKARSDKGKLRFSERDEQVLRWIGEMMIVRADQLQQLLGRDAQRPTLAAGQVSLGTVMRIVERWHGAGLAEVAGFYSGQPRYVWLTIKGQRDVGLPYKRTFDPSTKALVRHYLLVNKARLYVEDKYGEHISWVSERALFARKEHIDGHYVDGVVEFDDGARVAIEVEVTIKPVERTRKTMEALAKAYDNVTYFVLKTTKTSIERRIAELPAHLQESFQVILLAEDEL